MVLTLLLGVMIVVAAVLVVGATKSATFQIEKSVFAGFPHHVTQREN